MTTQPASEKLTKTEFNSLEDWKTYPTADYTCDKCNETVSIAFKDLAKHQLSDFTNFNDDDKKAFEQYERLSGQTKTNSFLDFYCPNCKRPVKIYYESWGGGRHMEGGYSIKYVID
jgi:hypothetical protein